MLRAGLAAPTIISRASDALRCAATPPAAHRPGLRTGLERSWPSAYLAGWAATWEMARVKEMAAWSRPLLRTRRYRTPPRHRYRHPAAARRRVGPRADKQRCHPHRWPGCPGATRGSGLGLRYRQAGPAADQGSAYLQRH